MPTGTMQIVGALLLLALVFFVISLVVTVVKWLSILALILVVLAIARRLRGSGKP